MRPTALVWLTLLSAGLAAQTYRPLLTYTATWQDENATASPGPNSSDYECRRYFLGGDTVIDETGYKVLLQTGRRSHWNNVFPSMNYTNDFDGSLVAFLREDTVQRLVHIRYPGWQSDFLLYDFSVNVGPYPYTDRYSDWSNIQVTEIDTVWLADGPHRRLHLGGIDAIVEGIGGMKGFMHSWIGGEYHWLRQLVCQTIDNSETYAVASGLCACGSNVGTVDLVSSPLLLSPVPTSDRCLLRGAKPNAPFRLYSPYGRVVYTGNCRADGSAILDLVDLPTGMYVVVVTGPLGPQSITVMKE
jgi:hypothetical protein